MTDQGGARRSRLIVVTAALAVILASALGASVIGHLAAVSGQQNLPEDGHDEVPGDGRVGTEGAELDGVLPHAGQVATCRYRAATGPAHAIPRPARPGFWRV